jgi:hypothetical protein
MVCIFYFICSFQKLLKSQMFAGRLFYMDRLMLAGTFKRDLNPVCQNSLEILLKDKIN